MKKNFIKLTSLLFLSAGSSALGQVGVNNETPKASLDITAKTTDGSEPEGILIPRLTGDEVVTMQGNLTAENHSMMVYVTEAATTTADTNLKFPGYYRFDYKENGGTPIKTWVRLEPSGLERVTENGKTGWRLIGVENGGNIGKGAIDLTTDDYYYPFDGATGNYSFAAGAYSTASGESSFAFGKGVTASKRNSFAFGESVTASGEKSFAFGQTVTASGESSSAFGQGVTASGEGSFGSGYLSEASGDFSVAMGNRPVASREGAVAMGSSHALGDYSFAVGYHSGVSKEYSLAMGYMARAEGTNTYAIGSDVIARGEYSFAIGEHSRSLGNYSFAIGDGVISYSPGSIAMGAYNTKENEFNNPVDIEYSFNKRRLFVLGNGTGSRHYLYHDSDAFTVLYNAKVGIDIDNFEATTSDAKLQVNGAIKVGTNGTTNEYGVYSNTDSMPCNEANKGSIRFVEKNGNNSVFEGCVKTNGVYEWKSIMTN